MGNLGHGRLAWRYPQECHRGKGCRLSMVSSRSPIDATIRNPGLFLGRDASSTPRPRFHEKARKHWSWLAATNGTVKAGGIPPCSVPGCLFPHLRRRSQLRLAATFSLRPTLKKARQNGSTDPPCLLLTFPPGVSRRLAGVLVSLGAL